MSRTVDPVAHAARRESFVDAAESLMRERGYAGLTIGDVIAAAGGSKGGFYHYFHSKQELLAAVVQRMTGATSDAVATIVAEPGPDAVAKFVAVVQAMPAGQPGNRELMLALLQVWYGDDNAALREATRQSSLSALAPSLRQLIEQGRRESQFATVSAAGAADVVATMLVGMADAAGRLWLARQAGTVTVRHTHEVLDAYADAIERVLGVPPRSTFPQDRALLRSWFG